jgi:AraC-like DNA-binding protein
LATHEHWSTALARVFEYYPPLKDMDEYVRGHLEERICLRQVAAVAGLQPKYFSHFFREKVGLTVTEWVAARRVERAVAMLQERNSSVAQVARMVGLGSHRTCERWFKRFTGMTPHQFKQARAPRVEVPGKRQRGTLSHSAGNLSHSSSFLC